MRPKLARQTLWRSLLSGLDLSNCCALTRWVALNRFVDDGDIVQLGEITATVIFNPGHTLGAISYWLRDHEAVFTGDTLFGAGCGRMFEGNPPMMHASLMRLAALPPTTRVYFGHEYTASNLRFATLVSPHDAAVAARVAAVAAQVAAGELGGLPVGDIDDRHAGRRDVAERPALADGRPGAGARGVRSVPAQHPA